jgi:predicted dehydrogenase
VEIKGLVDSGVLGEVLALSMSRRDLLIRTRPWLQQRRRVGGLLYQSASHEFDFIRWICGDPVEIYCLASPQIIAAASLDYPDLIISQVRFASGVIAQVWNCMTDPLTGYDGVVTGTNGTARFDLYNGMVQWQTLGGKKEARAWEPSDQWSAPAAIARGAMPQGEIVALHAMLENFRKAMEGPAMEGPAVHGPALPGSPGPVVSGLDGVWTVEMAQAGYLSISERRPVALPLTGADLDRLTYLEDPAA